MLRKGWDQLKRNPAWAALGLAIIIAIVNLVLLGGALQKGRLTRELEGQVEALEANIELLRQTESDGLQSLEDELTSAQTHLISLEASFPDIGTAFDLYRRGFELADLSNVELNSIYLLEADTLTTVVGTLEMTTYAVNSSGSLLECLSLLSQLENEGLQTLALDYILIHPPSMGCNFNVVVASASTLDVP